ncbi:hypothetical protein EDC96DRAFT_571717 [Choanephora cucurbitarum]|nr:hypothetical protein EDC96DRAFT_571717 [Choanephora cucurbitarum]
MGFTISTPKRTYRDERIPHASNKIIQWFKLDEFQPERAMTSHFISSKTLFLIRLVFALYSLVVLWVDIIYTAQKNEIKHFFVYFTDLTFIGLHAYLITTCIHHIKYLKSGNSKSLESFLKQPSTLNYLYVYLYHSVITYNILTPVVFWALLAKERLFEAHLSSIDFWISISLHTVTLCILMIEVLLNRMLVNTKLVLLVFITLLVYMGLVFIVFANEHWWVYPFLDWSAGPGVIVWYLLVSLLTILCFFFQLGLHSLRDKLVECWTTCSKNESVSSTFNHWEPAIDQSSGFQPLSSSILLESTVEPIK